MTIIEELLDRAGVQVSRTNREHEVYIDCPMEDCGAQMRLGINVMNGLAHCFKCDWKSRGMVSTVKQLAEAFEIPFQFSYTSARKEEEPMKVKVVDKIILTGLPAEYEAISYTDEDHRKYVEYLYGRGVTKIQIARHGIGCASYGELVGRVIFPVMDIKLRVYGCVARAVSPYAKPKYKNTVGSKMLWNAFRKGHTVILTEGILDALAVERAVGVDSGVISVARLGSSLTEFQLDQLRAFERVVVLPDRDIAGMKGALKVAGELAVNKINCKVGIPTRVDGIDPGDMQPKEINEYLESAKVYSPAIIYRMRIVAAMEGLSL